MKKLLVILLTFLLLQAAKSQTITNCRDTTEHKTKIVMVPTQVPYDTTYQKCDTVIDTIEPELRGFYVAYNAFTLGSQSSENAFLQGMKNRGANLLNYYARAKLYNATDRDKLAAFVKKAKEQYGIFRVTVDARLTQPEEWPGWCAYYAKYGNTISSIRPLAEFEPYRKNEAGIYPYPEMFVLLQKFDSLTAKYNEVFEWYEGWIGKYYSNPQAAVDSMVKHCGVIYVSNYVSVSDYTSTSSSLGIWDSRMRNRIEYGSTGYGGITKACVKLKKKIKLIEIHSIEPEMLQNYYKCPLSSTNKCKPFFGSTFEATKTRYNQSPAEVLQWTDLVGKTIFYTALLPNTGQ